MEGVLSEVVTPHFPNGLTIIEASGQWRSNGDRLEREPSRIVEIVQDELPDVKPSHRRDREDVQEPLPAGVGVGSACTR
jgi:hypothetical protein